MMTLREAAAPLLRHRRWIRALAVFQFTLGGVLALTLVGLLVAWFFIWIGVVLWQAAAALDEAALHPVHLDACLRQALDRLAFQFVLQAVLSMATLLVMLVAGLCL